MATKFAYQHEDIEKRRTDVYAKGLIAADILRADAAKLLDLQFQLGYGNSWGVIDIPEHFLPDCPLRNPFQRIFRVDQFLPDGTPVNSIEASSLWCEVLRYIVTRSLVPGIRRRYVIQPSTLLIEIRFIKQIAKVIAARSDHDGFFWSKLSDAEVLYDKSEKYLLPLINTISHYHAMGYLPDCFDITRTIQGDEPERNRVGEHEHVNKVDTNNQFQPFPDEFTSEMGWRSLRTIKYVGPTLLSAIEAALNVEISTVSLKGGQQLSAKTQKSKLVPIRNKVISDWRWTSSDHSPLEDLGFCLNMKSVKPSKGVAPELSWPPVSFFDALSIAESLLQPAHMFVILLANGSRNSEVISLTDTCLVEAPGGNYRWKGRTYKLVGAIGGREVDAIVPGLVTQAILQQVRLVKIFKKLHGEDSEEYLWGGTKRGKKKSLNDSLNRYVNVLGLKNLLAPENPSCHVHRFRKTLARMVALSLVNAPLILKDCFGHEDSEMTIRHYILSDPSIAREVLQIQKELVVLKAVDVINDIDNASGAASERLRQHKADYLKRIGKAAFEPEDAFEFARRETFDGRTWMVVAPGIICTLPHDAGGPCNKEQRGPNPANCRTGCENQLIQEYGIVQADDTVTWIIEQLQRAVDEESEMEISLWAGQLRTWLYRYNVITEKWKSHDLVQKYAVVGKAT